MFLDNKKRSVETININEEFDCLRTIILNVCDICNLQCEHCPHSKGFNSTNLMNMEVVEELVKQLKQYKYKGIVSISGFGEPTINLYLPRMIDLFYRNNIKVELLTNGKLSCDWKYLSKRCSKIKISIHNPEDSFDIPKLNNIEYRYHYIGSTTFYPTNRGGYLNIGEKQKGPCFYPYYSLFIDYDGHYLICGDDWYRNSKTNKNIFNTDIKEYFTNLEVKNKIYKSRTSCYLCCKNCSTKGVLIGENFKDWYIKEKLCRTGILEEKKD